MTTNAKELLMISFVRIATGELHLGRREWRRLGQRESVQIKGKVGATKGPANARV